MTTPAELLRLAVGEIGYTESPAGSNRTKYAALAGHANGAAWCATFCVAMARRAGLHLPSESAYTPAMATGFKAAGSWHTTPAAGDLAFFDFPDSKHRIQHVGIVESFTAKSVTSIEGNTSAGPGGSQDNGGGVFRRTRPRAHAVGFGRPRYSAASPSTAPSPSEDDVTEATAQAILAELRTLNQLVRDGVIDKLGRMGGDNFRIKARLGLPDKAPVGEQITALS